MEETTRLFLLGLAIGMVTMAFIMMSIPKHTRVYKECRLEMLKEAYAKGYAIREIDKEDKVIYKWK